MELLRPVITNNFIISPKIQMNNKKLGKDSLAKISITNELGIYGVLVQWVLHMIFKWAVSLKNRLNNALNL